LINSLRLLQLLFRRVPPHHPLRLLVLFIFDLVLAPTSLLLLLHLTLVFLLFMAYFCLLFIEFYLGSNIFLVSLLSRLGPSLLVHGVPHVLNTFLLEDGLRVREHWLRKVWSAPELLFVDLQQPSKLLFIHLLYF